MRIDRLVSIGAAIAVSLTLTSSALARAGDRTAAETYPVATALCVEAAHPDSLPPRLTANAGKVLTACNTLKNTFAPLVVTVDTAEAQYLSVLAAQKALVAAACVHPVSDRTACTTARQNAQTADATARQTRLAAVTAFHTAVEANRTTFWSTIQSLRSAPSTTA